jgi:melibiose permease
MITAKAKYSYGLGAFGKDLAYAIVAYYALFYFTDVAGVSPAFVGVLFLVARLWDAFNDPIMGWIVDNTRSRFGKFRPWIMIGTVLNALFTVWLFTIPSGISIEVWVAFTFILWGMTYTLMDIPFWSLVPALSKTKREREQIAVVPRMFASFAWFILGVAGIPLINRFGGEYSDDGYRTLAIIIAIIFVITSVIVFFNVKEIYPTDPDAEKITIKGAFRLIAENDQLRVLAVVLIGFNLMLQIAGGTALFYFTNVIGNDTLFSAYAGGMGLAQIGGLLILPKLAARVGRRNTFLIATVLPVVGFGSLMIVGFVAPMSAVLTAVTSIVANIGVGFWLGLSVVMLADVVDYGEYRFGTRNESLYFAIQPLAVKFAMAIAGFAVGIGLELANYDAEAGTDQPASAIFGIRLLMFGLPILSALVAYFVYRKYYKIVGSYQEKIMATLSERAAEEGEGNW